MLVTAVLVERYIDTVFELRQHKTHLLLLLLLLLLLQRFHWVKV